MANTNYTVHCRLVERETVRLPTADGEPIVQHMWFFEGLVSAGNLNFEVTLVSPSRIGCAKLARSSEVGSFFVFGDASPHASVLDAKQKGERLTLFLQIDQNGDVIGIDIEDGHVQQRPTTGAAASGPAPALTAQTAPNKPK